MGVFDFVRNGVREMMIARPDSQKSLIVYKHPDQNIPMYSQLTVDSDECAVFFRDGRVVGVLPPGRVTLQTDNIPFLNALVTIWFKKGIFCVWSVCRPGGRTPTTRPSLKKTAHSSLSTVSCEYIGTF